MFGLHFLPFVLAYSLIILSLCMIHLTVGGILPYFLSLSVWYRISSALWYTPHMSISLWYFQKYAVGKGGHLTVGGILPYFLSLSVWYRISSALWYTPHMSISLWYFQKYAVGKGGVLYICNDTKVCRRNTTLLRLHLLFGREGKHLFLCYC